MIGLCWVIITRDHSASDRPFSWEGAVSAVVVAVAAAATFVAGVAVAVAGVGGGGGEGDDAIARVALWWTSIRSIIICFLPYEGTTTRCWLSDDGDEAD